MYAPRRVRRERHDWSRFYAIDLRSKRWCGADWRRFRTAIARAEPALFRRFPEGAIHACQRQGATIYQIQIGGVEGEVCGRRSESFENASDAIS